MRVAIVALVVIAAWSSHQTGRTQRPDTRPDKGALLENLTWPDAERLLSPETVVVIPVGAASLEHGPHLKLGTDLTVANTINAAKGPVPPTLLKRPGYPGDEK